jgi:hypothetical protein
MHDKASLALGVLIMICAGWAVYAATGWPWKAALFPIAIGIPVFSLAAVEVACVLFGRGKADRAPDFQISSDVPARTALIRTAQAVGWMIALFVSIVLLSFPVAVPVFLFLYLKLQGRESWLFSLLFSAVVWVLFYLIFQHLLNVPFPAGWLQAWIGLA